MQRRPRPRDLTPFLLALVCLSLPAFGQDAGLKVEIHGFGDWVYGRTNNSNFYLSGLPGGNYRDVNLGLNLVARVSDRLKIVGQAEWRESESYGRITQVDYSFAEWTFSDSLAFRAGQVKQPFGISGEVSTVGTLRPFFSLPQAVYGPVGLVGLAYRGVGLTGSKDLGKGWSASYDAYGGGTVVEEYEPPEALLRGEPVVRGSSEIEVNVTKDLYGGRVRVDTPLSGLSIGLSGYQGKGTTGNRRWAAGADTEYLSDTWSIRAEYVHGAEIDHRVVHAFYVEAAYRLNRHWQAAVQYGRLSTSLSGVDASPAPSLLDHKELAAGLNYWFAPGFVLKLAYHHVHGNRLAGPEPEDLNQVVAAGQLKTWTNLVQLGAQFSF